MDTGIGTDNIGPLLARANLFRMRGQWSDAAEVCAEVLRLSPHNANAHSLLGDIYQDQGRPEEARHWYHLALELHPDSPADRAKLARVEEMLEARQQRAEWQAVIDGRVHPVSTSLRVRESVQRIGAIAGAALCGIILVAATLISMAEHPVNSATNPGLPFPGFMQRVKRPLPPDTPRERTLLDRVATASGPGLAQPVRLTLDPRTHAAELRVFLPAKAREHLTTPSFRIRVLREAYRSAYALHRADPTITDTQVYVVGPVILPSGATDSDLLLLDSISAKDLWQDPDAVPPDKLLAAFSEDTPPWWSADLRGM